MQPGLMPNRRGLKACLLAGLMAISGGLYGFDLQGHRGARGLAPENTLPGFARALAIGVTTLELDLAVTADRIVVVSHNPRLEPELARHADGSWLEHSSAPIRSMTLRQVRRYDVGRLNPAYEYARRFPRQQGLDGVRIPVLAEVFELARRARNEAVRFNIEIKTSPEKPQLAPSPGEFAAAVVEVVRAQRMTSRVSIQSFDWRALQALQRMAPEISTSYLSTDQRWLNNLQSGVPGPSPWLGGLDIDDFDGSVPRAIEASGGDTWSAYHREVDADSIELAHALGLQVTVWTVNDSGRMRELIAMGVDGIITDYPDRLRGLLLELGMAVPKATPVVK